MNDLEIRQQVARALGREIDGPAERRLTLVLGAVLATGGHEAEVSLASACGVYERMMDTGNLPKCPILRPPRPGG